MYLPTNESIKTEKYKDTGRKTEEGVVQYREL